MTGYLQDLIELAKVGDYNLYHTTNSSNAFKILHTNSLKLSLAETNSSESKFAKKLFYLSFARTPASGYIADRAPGLRTINESVLFVFDKRKLNQLRGVTFSPVDYWGAGENGRIFGGGAKESEDRMFSDTAFLKNINSTIKEVRVVVGEDKYDNNPWLLNVVLECKKKKIPVKLFNKQDKDGFIYGKEDKSERKRLFDLLKQEGLGKPRTSTAEYNRASIIKKKAPEWVGSADRGIRVITELFYKDKLEDLSKEARRFVYDYNDRPGFLRYFETDVHNLRAGNPIDQKRFYSLLKNAKVKKLSTFINQMFDKWKNIRESR